MGKVDHNDPRPPYVQIADDLRRQITSGERTQGARLPSGRDLAKLYDVAPMTVQNALGLLRDEGLVESWQGRGVFVSSAAPEDPTADLAAKLDAVTAEVAQLRKRVAALERSTKRQ